MDDGMDETLIHILEEFQISRLQNLNIRIYLNIYRLKEKETTGNKASL